MRIGLGQDSHIFEEGNGKKLVLGGAEIEGVGMKANSDGDVILHALCNALGSAIGIGSVSTYADKMCLEDGVTDSKEYIKVPLRMIDEKGFRIENISLSLECKTPKIESIREKIVESLSNILAIDKTRIGVTATSGENMTEAGKGKGIQCFVVVLLSEKN